MRMNSEAGIFLIGILVITSTKGDTIDTTTGNFSTPSNSTVAPNSTADTTAEALTGITGPANMTAEALTESTGKYANDTTAEELTESTGPDDSVTTVGPSNSTNASNFTSESTEHAFTSNTVSGESTEHAFTSNTVSVTCKACIHGVCKNGECNCEEGFQGDSCSETICSKPCYHGECVGTNECSCDENWGGSLCDEPMCGEKAIQVHSDVINIDCGSTASPVDNVTAYFAQTVVGTSAPSNITCGKCGDFDGKPVASYKCILGDDGYATWEESEVSWLDCSQALASMNTEDKADAIATITSDPASMTDDDVTSVVDAMSTISESENLTQEVTENTLTAASNIMLAEESEAVQDQSNEILESIDNIADVVVLEPNTEGELAYEQTESTLALAVLETTPSRSAKSISNPQYYGTNNPDFYEDSNLAVVGLKLFPSEPSISYVKVPQPKEGERVSFTAYQYQNNLFPEPDEGIDIVSIVYSVQVKNVEFKFHRADREV